MTNVLDKLHEDHKNFTKLLNYLEQQLKLLKDCERLDLELILKALQYMKEYPDLVHHPLEDVIFKYFIEHHGKAQNDLKALLQEHSEMPELTNRLIEMIQGALSDLPQNRQELCTNLQTYLVKQKEHLNHEEEHVYPVIRDTMTDQEWQNIDSSLENVSDPLFGKKVVKNYQALLHQVVE
jgi:hemerythrin-like domain-containing protein